jgi:hypothetical protein
MKLMRRDLVGRTSNVSLETFEQVDDLRLRHVWCRDDVLAVRNFPSDSAEDFPRPLVAESARLEGLTEKLVNQTISELPLERFELEGRPRVDFVEGAYFVGVEALLKEHPFPVRAEDDEFVVSATGEAANRDELPTTKRVRDELIRTVAALVGCNEVASLDVERVNGTSSRRRQIPRRRSHTSD